MFAEKERVPRGINMVPLINIVFLLLVFFMLTSTIRVIDPVDALLPEAGTGSLADPPGATLVVSGDGSYLLDGGAVPADGLAPALAALVGAGVEEILVKTDGDGTVDLLRTVLETARAAGVARVALATRPEGG